MKITILIFCLILIPLILVNSFSHEIPDWENPGLFERNQVAPHAALMSFGIGLIHTGLKNSNWQKITERVLRNISKR